MRLKYQKYLPTPQASPVEIRKALNEMGVTQITNDVAVAVAKKFGESIESSKPRIRSWVSRLIIIYKNGEENDEYIPIQGVVKKPPKAAPPVKSDELTRKRNRTATDYFQAIGPLREFRNRMMDIRSHQPKKPKLATQRRIAISNPKRTAKKMLDKSQPSDDDIDSDGDADSEPTAKRRCRRRISSDEDYQPPNTTTRNQKKKPDTASAVAKKTLDKSQPSDDDIDSDSD